MLIPSSTRLTLTRLFVKRPAQARSAIEIAICVVASVVRNHLADLPPPGWPACP